MLIDMHAHSSAISRCCQAPAEEIIRIARANGIGGLVLSNHYDFNYTAGIGAAAFARAYADEFIYCGMKAGIEHSSRAIAMDLSHYGIRVNCVAPGATHSGKPSPRRAAVQKQKNGLNYMIQEGGFGLSGGQRQTLLLALHLPNLKMRLAN